MDAQSTQIIAGSISSLLFISSNIPMLVKAFKTKNMNSYSLSNMVLTNIGNLIYWLYVSSLPFGPIWLMHSFYTVASILMLVWYVRYEFSHRTRNLPAWLSCRWNVHHPFIGQHQHKLYRRTLS